MAAPGIDRRRERAATNESLFREVNERVQELTDTFELSTEMTDLICECAQTDCAQRIRMTASEYEAMRRVATQFAVAEGHELPDVETIVEKTNRYVIVAKIGTAAKVATELDPRAPSRV